MASSVDLVMGVARLNNRIRSLIGLQVDPSNFPRWIFDALVWGCLVLLIEGLIIGMVLLIQGRRIRRQADEAGVEAPLPKSSRDFKPFGIDQGYWIIAGIILVVIVWIFAPLIRAAFTETQIVASFFLILAGVAWFSVFYGIIYILREYPKRQRLLQEAIHHKDLKSPSPTQCSTCGAPLLEDAHFCNQCGASTK